MIESPKPDVELIEYIFHLLYGDGSYCYIPSDHRDDILKSFHEWDIKRAYRKLLKEGYIRELHFNTELAYALSDLGMEIMKRHGTFKNYINFKKRQDRKKERKDNFDRNVKNGNIIAALIISSMTLYIGQCSNMNTSRQQKIEQEVESVSKGLDSLKQELKNTQKLLQK